MTFGQTSARPTSGSSIDILSFKATSFGFFFPASSEGQMTKVRAIANLAFKTSSAFHSSKQIACRWSRENRQQPATSYELFVSPVLQNQLFVSRQDVNRLCAWGFSWHHRHLAAPSLWTSSKWEANKLEPENEQLHPKPTLKVDHAQASHAWPTFQTLSSQLGCASTTGRCIGCKHIPKARLFWCCMSVQHPLEFSW